MHSKAIVVAGTMFFSAVLAEAKSYYISPDGDNGNSGLSPHQAWASLSKLSALSLSGGDTIYLKGGDTLDSPAGMQLSNANAVSGNGAALTDPALLETLAAYEIPANSPCVNAGIDVELAYGIVRSSRDFFGTTLPYGQYDVGACEFQPSSSAVPWVMAAPPVYRLTAVHVPEKLYSLSGRMAGQYAAALIAGFWRSGAGRTAGAGVYLPERIGTNRRLPGPAIRVR